MTVELTADEQDFLLEILRDRLGSLREQVHHSMTSTFTDQLKEKEVLLKGLIEKVETAGGPEQCSTPGPSREAVT